MDLKTAQITTTAKLPILKQGAPITESIDSIFNWLWKIISQLAILGENILQEDLNLKFLRSMSSEWNTHVVVWSNKPDLETMSFDDLYNNFNIVEQEVKRTTSSSSQNMAFVSSPSSTNEVNTAYRVSTANTQVSPTNTQVSPASTQVSIASTQVSTANLSDATVYAFLANQPNGSQLVHEDLEKIYEDDLEEMDLKWQLALLSMRTRRFFSKTGRKITINESDIVGYDNSRRTVNVEETSSKSMVAIDGVFDRAIWQIMKSLQTWLLWIFQTLSKKGVGFVSYNVVPSSHKGLFSSLNLDLSYTGLEEFQQPKFEGYGPKTSKSVSEDISNEVRESSNAPLVEELVSDDKLEKKTIFPTVAKIEFVRPKQQEKPVRKPVKYAEMYRLNAITIKGKGWNMASRAVLMKTGLRPLNNVRTVNIAHPKTTVYSARPMPKSINTARPNSTVVNAVRENQVNAVKALACWVWRPTKLNSASITLKRHNYVDAQGRKKKNEKKNIQVSDGLGLQSGLRKDMTGNMSYLSDFKDFDRGYVTFGGGSKRGKIHSKGTLKTGKFDGKPDEGFFVGYSLNSKAFKVYNIRTRKVEENLNIRFLEDKPIIVGNGPKWLFDIDVLKKSMIYVPVVASTNSNDFVDGSLFDFSSKNASNDEPQPSSDAGKKEDEGVSKESGNDDQERPENSIQDVNTAGPSINTKPDMFSLGDNATLEATHADFFGDETEVNMSNITTVYLVPSTPNTRIHKGHSLNHVIGDVHSDEELLQFKLQKVWVLVDLPKGKRAIGTKWVFRNKKDERARIEAIRLFLAYASFMGFMVYQMDMKSAFLYGRIEEVVYVCQPLGFEDLDYPYKVYKVVKALYGLHQAPRACIKPWPRLQVNQKEDGIFISQDKYVADILRKFSFTDVRIASTPMDIEKPLIKDSDSDDVDVHLYRSMIGSLMYLTSSRPDIMFAVCACARFQVTPKVSHLHVVKRIFSDYARASLDRKSTTGGCQFLGCRLISWQCKKQTVVATSSTKAEYVAAASCCGQVLWIQNQMLDYGISKAVWLDLVIPIVEFVRGKSAD
ncbi:putative ribonuclease H-like domain-containing protein [Tanacetum coccineum]|uniref:Ribonuclease H-like domain-containing protein n=1 Tax=Tanacetum coccineum TaxID=301880 RepID=A0ABQ5CJN8_9ASTR